MKIKNGFFVAQMNALAMDLYGEAFDEQYLKYEQMHDEDKLFNSRKISARELWFKILDSQMETGTLICFIKMHVIKNQIKKHWNY